MPPRPDDQVFNQRNIPSLNRMKKELGMKCISSCSREYIGIVAFVLTVMGVAAGISHAIQHKESTAAPSARVAVPEISPAEVQRTVSSAKYL